MPNPAADLGNTPPSGRHDHPDGERCPSVAVARDLVAALELPPDLAARLLEVARPAGRSAASVASV